MYDIFSLPVFHFPEGFVWGSATAGHQIEGDNIHSQLWQIEQAGKFGTPSGKACNHYALYRQDIELIRSLGHRAFRLSVEWSRIEPAEGEFNAEAVEHYLDEIRLLKEAGLQVFVTLVHGTYPDWLEQKGGMRVVENIPCFERFVAFIVPKLAAYVDQWYTLNEPNLGWPAETRETIRNKITSLRFHASGYQVLKQYTQAPAAYTHAFIHYFPFRRYDPFDNLMTQFKDWLNHEMFFHAIRTGEIVTPYFDAEVVPALKDSCDFWAVQYYTRHMVDARTPTGDGKRFEHKLLKMIPTDFYLEEMFPEGLIANLERLGDKPVYITENGCCCDDDRFRIVYLALHLSALKEAIDRGIDVRGYLYWSFMDNYEWGSFLPRFGLVHVDFDTFQRTPKPSAYFYREIIAQNGLTPDLIARYLKEMPSLAKK